MTLVSFDIDGTMEFGDPPGAVTLERVRRAQARGYIVGSASDRPESEQQRLWDVHGIVVDFVSLKHRLADLKERFDAVRHLHIGDTPIDEHFARRAGFDFQSVHELPEDGAEGWIF